MFSSRFQHPYSGSVGRGGFQAVAYIRCGVTPGRRRMNTTRMIRMNRSAHSPRSRPDAPSVFGLYSRWPALFPRRLAGCSEYISGRIGCIQGGGKALVFVLNRRAAACAPPHARRGGTPRGSCLRPIYRRVTGAGGVPAHCCGALPANPHEASLECDRPQCMAVNGVMLADETGVLRRRFRNCQSGCGLDASGWSAFA
ncbi:hypothetical protein SBC2_28050 [Caballeronia sp. SBC2]|nr:hypothetical protein SBC2_28050 [Caballeronia sp. SBC2]